FRTQLSTLLKKIHGTNQHFGKAPRNVSTSTKKKTSKLQDLKKQLILAVKLEDFEKAAIVRDKIREIEKGK
ncbi:MAG: protein arginine kinase activator, partial [Candidatus Omnitrophota bacterium]